MGRIAAEPDWLTSPDGHDPTACVGAVERARTPDLTELHGDQVPRAGPGASTTLSISLGPVNTPAHGAISLEFRHRSRSKRGAPALSADRALVGRRDPTR